jgi:ubiquinone/menaquinone biosynthesis C-methylase UbiE
MLVIDIVLKQCYPDKNILSRVYQRDYHNKGIDMVKNDNQPETLVQKRFSQHARAYVTSEPHSKGSDLDLLLTLAQPQKEWIMLDVATGGGHTALKFAPYVDHVYVTDITPAMLDAAEENLREKGIGNTTYKLAAAEELPFDESLFDLVTCRIAPHHFDNVERFLTEVARVLKPTGFLLVQDHLMPEDDLTARYIEAFEKLRDPSHNRAFNLDEWRKMFNTAGLRVTVFETMYKDLNFESWTARQGVTSNTKACLNALMDQAPISARKWMYPQRWGTPEATYRCHHIILKGEKHHIL